jgi:hypothetical protein
LFRPDGAGELVLQQTQGGTRSSLALGWLVEGPLAFIHERRRDNQRTSIPKLSEAADLGYFGAYFESRP